jgi:hypothetical protein
MKKINKILKSDLWVTEYGGDAMIGLCSKIYIVQKTTTIHTSSTVMAAFRLLRRAKRLQSKRLVNRVVRRRNGRWPPDSS